MLKHTEAGDRWRARLAYPDGTLPARAADADAERAFWRQRLGNGLPERDAYAERVWDALAAECAGRGIRSVLEIGPGWGNYTFPLLERFGTVTAVDISPDNLEALSGRARAAGLHLDTVCSAWEDAQAEPRDLVFAYNCFYRLTEPELFFRKIDEAAVKLCVIGMNRPPELPWLTDMEKAGLPVRYTRQGCEEMREVLASVGIEARLLDIPNERTYAYPGEQALLRRAQSFLPGPVPGDTLLPLLMPYHLRQPDGSLVCLYRFTSQLLVWEPRHQS